MQLLLQRRQGKNWIGLSIFKLWAKFDLTSEETALIEKYQVQGYVLSEGNFRRDFLKALLWTIPIALILVPITIPLMGSSVGPRLAPFLFLIILWLLYNQIREQIKINDMLNGRFFSCRSVIFSCSQLSAAVLAIIADCCSDWVRLEAASCSHSVRFCSD